MSIFSRKNQPRARKTSRNSGRGRKGGGILSLWIEIFVFLILAFLVYATASLFSLRTGAWGEQIRFSMLRNWGGASLIPLLFGCYLCISYFLKTVSKGFIRQFFGTFLLFLCIALLFGLFRMAGVFQGIGVLSPGYLGDGLAIFLTRSTGALGTILLAAALLILSSTLYGLFIPASVVMKLSAVFKVLASDRWKKMPYPAEEKKSFQAKTDHRNEDTAAAAPSSFSYVQYSEEDHGAETPGKTGEDTPEDSPVSLEEVPDQEHTDLAELLLRPPVKKGEKNEEPLPVFPEEVPEEVPEKVPPEEEQAEETGDPHALPEIEFNEVEGSERKVRGAAFPPPLDIFGPKQQFDSTETNETVKEQADSIIATLNDFGVLAEMMDVVIGPTVIQFQIQLAPGIKVSKVAGLSNDLAVALAVPSLRIEAPIPGKTYVGIEIPNPKRRGISIRTILESQIFQDNEYDLPLPMGVRVDSRPLVVGLEDLPHLLVAGTTGSGKSVFVTSCITGLCSYRSPEELRLILIDPKRVELSIYENLPHVLAKPVVSPKKAVQALAWAVREMEHRYEIFARARVRNLKSYNQCVLPKAQLPHIVIVVDELADLMFTAQKEVEDYICRLAQMARATGIHLILATQRPSVNVITGLIKANVPARVAFTLPSQTDSRTIIDVSGAERLLGKGDMLFVSSRYPRPLRVQSPFIDDSKSLEIIAYLRNVFGDPEYVDIEDQGTEAPAGGDTSFADDPLLEEAVDIVLDTGIASASRLQRQLRVGFTRAARLIDTMEQMGIVGPPEGSKPREILVDDERARDHLRSAAGGEE